MKRSTFLNRTATVKVDFGNGDIVECLYKPRYLTKPVLEKLESLADDEKVKASVTLEQLAVELGNTVVYLDIEDDESEHRPINPDVSAEERSTKLVELLDINSLATLLSAIRKHIEDPTADGSTNLSSGSLEKVH